MSEASLPFNEKYCPRLPKFLLEKNENKNGKNPLKTLKNTGLKKPKPSTGLSHPPRFLMTQTRRFTNGSPMEN